MALAGLSESWLLTPNNQQQSPKEIVNLLNFTMSDNIRGALERYAQAQKATMKKEAGKFARYGYAQEDHPDREAVSHLAENDVPP